MELKVEPHERPAKGSFSMKANGQLFTPMGNGFGYSLQKEKDGYILEIDARDKNNTSVGIVVWLFSNYNGKDGKEINFNVDSEGGFAEVDYSLGSYHSGRSLAEAKGYFSKSGTIRFSEISPNRLIGEFKFDVGGYLNTEETISITEGKFDLYY